MPRKHGSETVDEARTRRRDELGQINMARI